MPLGNADIEGLLAPCRERYPALVRVLLDELPNVVEQTRLAPGDMLLRQGERPKALFIVVAGCLSVVHPRADGSQCAVGSLRTGDLVGELALLAGQASTVTVLAAEPSAVLRVPARDLLEVDKFPPEIITEVNDAARQRMRRDQIAAALKTLCGEADDELITDLESEGERLSIRGGDVLFRQGDDGDAVYLVTNGRLRAIQQLEDGTQRVLNEIAAGGVVGEMALLTGEKRSAAVAAIRESELLRIPRDVFDRLTSRHPRLALGLARELVWRLRRTQGSAGRPRSALCLALVPMDVGLPPRWPDRLVAALRDIGNTLLLRRESVEPLPDAGSWQSSEDGMAAWLDAAEAEHEIVVYLAEPNPTEWTSLCLRQADIVLLAARAPSESSPGERERAMLAAAAADHSCSAKRFLLLLHESAGHPPSDSAKWFAGRRLDGIFHVPLDQPAAFGRVARILTGRAHGVVLGGGGARGLAHIGVLRAFAEHHVPVDVIAGTSMGAVFAALHAKGFAWDEILELSREIWLRVKPQEEYTLPVISFIRSRKLDRVARRFFGERVRIEDLWIPYFCVSCNLSRSHTVVHDRGILWRAVRASAALPGAFVPMVEGGDILVDGSVLNNLPGDIMRARYGGTLSVVDVSKRVDLRMAIPVFPSPWRLFWRWVLPGRTRPDVPHVLRLILRTTIVSSLQVTEQVCRSSDFLFRPPVDAYGMLQFKAHDQIVEAGYRYTCERLQELERDPAFAARLRGQWPEGGDAVASPFSGNPCA